MELILYDRARRALQECSTIDEAKDLADKAQALQVYARQKDDKEMECMVAEIKIRAKRRIGEISLELEKIAPEDSGKNGANARWMGVFTDEYTHNGKLDTLENAGISQPTASRCEKIAEIAEVKFEEAIAELKEQQRPITYKDIEKKVAPNVHVSNNSGNNEWYTPSSIIESARKVMGSIDLDPASSDLANQTVKAARFYTAHDNGLGRAWNGNVWMNPPYAQPLIAQFSQKLVDSLAHIDQAIVLVNNATETKWFQTMALHCSCICLVTARVKFISPEGGTSQPLQGQVLFYFTHDRDLVARFNSEFSTIGACFKPI